MWFYDYQKKGEFNSKVKDILSKHDCFNNNRIINIIIMFSRVNIINNSVFLILFDFYKTIIIFTI